MPMFGGGQSGQDSHFAGAAMAFEVARQAACSESQRQHIRDALTKTIAAIDRYVAYIRGQELRGIPCGKAGGFAARWDIVGGLRQQLEAMTLPGAPISDLQSICKLQSGGGGMLADMIGKAMGGSSSQEPPMAVEHMPFLDTGILLNGVQLPAMIARWSE